MYTLVIFSLLYLTYADLQNSGCRPREYKFNDVCCPMCDKGTVVKSHCTETSSSSVCVSCSDGTYMDHFNGETNCLRCTECDIGAGMLVKKECTKKSNAECECKPGYHCSGGDMCDLCIPHTICVKGTYLRMSGNSNSDNVCEACPPGRYSNSEMSPTCTPWTKCSDQGEEEHQPGSPVSDVTCRNKRNQYAIIASAVAVAVFGVIVIIKRDNLKFSEEEENRIPGAETCNLQL